MGLLCSSFILEPRSHNNLTLLGKKLTYFSQSSKYATGNKIGLRLHFWIQKLPLSNFKTKVELPPILPSYPRLTLRIFIANVFAMRKAVRREFVDMSKAFDRVWQKGFILYKMKRIGIRGVPLKLILHFLKNRFQEWSWMVKHLHGNLYQLLYQKGSILGPLFFLIYINDSTKYPLINH